MTVDIWQTIVNKINAQLKTIIPAHYKLNDTLDIFNQFCINEALAKIENNLLKLLYNILT